VRIFDGLQKVEDYAVGGLTIEEWVRLFNVCYIGNGFGVSRVEWPDPGGVSEQPALTVFMFQLLEDVLSSVLEAKRKSGK